MHRTLSARLRSLRDDDGFTLIELLVVIIIIGILAAIAIPVFLHQRQKGYDASAKSDLRNAATAEESYFADHGSYAKLSTINAATPIALSSGDTIATVFLDANKGYCLGAINSKGSTAPGVGGLPISNIVWWYDSSAGGLQPENTAITNGDYGCPAINPSKDGLAPADLYNIDRIGEL